MLDGSGQKMERKFWIALGLYGILIVIAWFTLGIGSVVIFGGPVQIRLIVVVILGTFVFRTIMARWAENIRRNSGEDTEEL
jgi:hypothetical protein